MTNQGPRLLRGHARLAGQLGVFLDPAVAILTLLVLTRHYGQGFDAPYVILGLLAFSLSFPGRWQFDTGVAAMLRDILLSWLAVACALLLLGYASTYLNVFPRGLIVAWLVATPLALAAAHLALRALMPWLLRRSTGLRHAVIVGANELGIQLCRRLRTDVYAGIRVLGFFDDREHGRAAEPGELPRFGPTSALADFVRDRRVEHIYLALPMAAQPRILKLLDELRDTTASIYFVPDIYVTDLIQARMDEVAGMPVVAVCDTPFSGLDGLVKRLSDLVLASLILVLLSPVLLAVAIAVKLGSPGPVLFRQRRYGLDGQEIVVYKFRTMSVCEDGDHVPQARRDDARITRCGAFLRRSSLDELPQFFNVLQGRMSIVGPRPHAVAHNELYRKLIKGYMVRHKVKPGITGLAQVNGLRGETRSLEKMQARIDYDLQYLRSWSLRLDLQIILRTVWIVLSGDRHAY